MATNFTWSAEAPTAKAAKTKSGKTRGSNPPGARTKNEPPRVVPKPAYREELQGFNYRPATKVAKPDTLELRKAVGQAVIDLGNAHQAYLDAMRRFTELGPLPDSIIGDLPQSMRRHMKLYKTHKPQPVKPPYRVLRTFESESRKGKWYEIREDKLGHILCTCPAFKFGRSFTCKHIGQMDKDNKEAKK
jgi:hypothetical protein